MRDWILTTIVLICGIFMIIIGRNDIPFVAFVLTCAMMFSGISVFKLLGMMTKKDASSEQTVVKRK